MWRGPAGVAEGPQASPHDPCGCRLFKSLHVARSMLGSGLLKLAWPGGAPSALEQRQQPGAQVE